MVSKAIDEGLLKRIQKYVSNDINSRIVMTGSDKDLEVKPEDVFILTFTRVLNNWECTATAEPSAAGLYKLVHDGSNDQTIVSIFIRTSLHEAVI